MRRLSTRRRITVAALPEAALASLLPYPPFLRAITSAAPGVVCHEHCSIVRVVLPQALDHPVASRWTT